MHRNPNRPLSPHLSIWKWGPHMLVSILHRVTGTGLGLVGGAVFVWWLAAAASGADAYATFTAWAIWKWSLIVWIGLSWAFYQHLLSGVRHFVMDIGAGFELETNRTWSMMTLILAVLLTGLTWLYIIYWRTA
jgi:succinate dehydrogenase / fumarate reductase cytochrome b subunit